MFTSFVSLCFKLRDSLIRYAHLVEEIRDSEPDAIINLESPVVFLSFQLHVALIEFLLESCCCFLRLL